MRTSAPGLIETGSGRASMLSSHSQRSLAPDGAAVSANEAERHDEPEASWTDRLNMQLSDRSSAVVQTIRVLVSCV